MPRNGDSMRSVRLLAAGAVLAGLVLAGAAGAADKPGERYKVRDRYGRVVSTITPDEHVAGRLKVRDRQGRVLGTIENNGKARDRFGRPVPLTKTLTLQ